jgi:hypothetical protein
MSQKRVENGLLIRRQKYLLAYKGRVLFRSSGNDGEPRSEIAEMGEQDAQDERLIRPDEGPKRDLILRECLLSHGEMNQ